MLLKIQTRCVGFKMSYPFEMPMRDAFGGVLGLGLAFGVASDARAFTINTTAEGRYIRWMRDSVVARADAQFLDMLASGAARESLSIAFEAWRGYSGVPDLLIGEGSAAEPGFHPGQDTNTVHYLPSWPYEDEKLAVTVITYELESGKLLDADVLVNGGVNYQMLSEAHPDRHFYDLAAVLTHEAGHMLGLGESPGNEEATMYPYAYPGQTHQRTLSEDDEAAIQMSYNGIELDIAEPVGGCRIGSGNGSLTGGRLLGKITATFWPIVVALGAARLLPGTPRIVGRRSVYPSMRPAALHSLRPSLLPTLPPSLLTTWRPSMTPGSDLVIPSMRAPRLPSIIPSWVPPISVA